MRTFKVYPKSINASCGTGKKYVKSAADLEGLIDQIDDILKDEYYWQSQARYRVCSYLRDADVVTKQDLAYIMEQASWEEGLDPEFHKKAAYEIADRLGIS